MGRHTASTAGNGTAVANAAATAKRPPSEETGVQRIKARNDGRWMVGFLLGFCTGLLLLYAGFLWWLTGGLVDTLSSWF